MIGKIVETYGFDLSPLSVRYGEFMAAAERGRKDRETRARLRRRLTIACKAIRQIGEAALEADLMTGINGQNWRQWAEDAAHVAEGIGIDPSIEGLQQAVAELERRCLEAESALKDAFMAEDNAPADAADCAPITTTNQLPAEKSAIGNNDLEQPYNDTSTTLFHHPPRSPEKTLLNPSSRRGS